MSTHTFRLSYAPFTVLFCALIASPLVSANCGCPSDKNGTPQPPPPPPSTGLGQAFPVSTDLAADPKWQIYQFERDGVRYVQINDWKGQVRAAVGRIDGTFWVLPLGSDADRVSIQGDVTPKGQAKVLYRGSDIEVVQYRDGNRDSWLIRAPLDQNKAPGRAPRASQ